MNNVYSSDFIHLVWSTKNRIHFIESSYKDRLYSYITGIAQKRGDTIIAIGGMQDHIHILVSLKPTASVAQFVCAIKSSSSKFMRQFDIETSTFSWQTGYGRFSVSASMLNAVKIYIQDQEKNHVRRSFEEEFFGLLEKHNISYDPIEALE